MLKMIPVGFRAPRILSLVKPTIQTSVSLFLVFFRFFEKQEKKKKVQVRTIKTISGSPNKKKRNVFLGVDETKNPVEAVNNILYNVTDHAGPRQRHILQALVTDEPGVLRLSFLSFFLSFFLFSLNFFFFFHF